MQDAGFGEPQREARVKSSSSSTRGPSAGIVRDILSSPTTHAQEAIAWIDERGGVWLVRATPTVCEVVASMSSVQVTVLAPWLSLDGVRAALLEAVSDLRNKRSDPACIAFHRTSLSATCHHPLPAMPVVRHLRPTGARKRDSGCDGNGRRRRGVVLNVYGLPSASSSWALAVERL